MKRSRRKKRDKAVRSESVKRYTEGEERKNPQNRRLGGPESGESRGTAAGILTRVSPEAWPGGPRRDRPVWGSPEVIF